MSNSIYLNYIEDLFLRTESIYSWHLSPDFELVYSNHPTPTPMKNIFMVSSCSAYLRRCFAATPLPLFLYDDLFFQWAAVPAFSESSQLIGIYLLGPIFNSYTSDSYIKEKLDIQNMSIKSKKELLDLIKKIPVIPTVVFSRYVCQLYFTLNGTAISVDDIKLQNNSLSSENGISQKDMAAAHTPYYYETLLLKSVEDGVPIPNLASLLASSQVGILCPGDPLRQKKDEAVSLITLFTRAGIQSGIDAEKAYLSSDSYIQSIEAVRTIPEVMQIIETMYLDTTHQVHELKVTIAQIHNSLVHECLNYLDLHYKEDINLDQLAGNLGYTKYYLSSCFKKDLGISISEYLTDKRISYAKVMLSNPHIDIQDISDELHFSNPSHFSSVFRKHTGVTPTQYRKSHSTS